jgi:WD40 repeat protein
MDDIPVKEYDASFDLHDDHTGSKAKPQIVCAALVGMRNTDHKGDSVVFATGNSDGTIRLYELKIDRSTGGRPYTINALVGTDHKPLILECKDRGDEEERFSYLPLNVSSRENDTVLSLACSSDLSLTDGNGDGNGGGDGDGNSDAGGDGAAGGAAVAAALGFHRGDFLVAGFASGHIVMWDISGFFDLSHSKTSSSTMRSKVRRQSSSAFVSHSIPKPILSLPAHFGGVEVVRIVPECRTIITGSDDGTVCMWRLNRFVETGGATSSSTALTDTDAAWVDVECIGTEKEFALHSKNRKKHVDHLGQFGVMQMVKEDGTSMDDTGTAATIQVCVHFRKDKINLDRELLRHFRQPPSLRLRFHSGAVRDLIVLQPREGEVKGVSDELPLLITASTDSDTRVWSKQHFKLLRTAPRVLGASARGEGSAAASEAHETPNPLLLLPSTDPANLEVYSE